ncbi:carbon-nitrogen hydrolase family protein [Salinibacterium sp. SYSU T00001]|uniref:carbon-nitrogen hydrolase family protein n=1 Tax=Homoserinimonas sedimenticola TaxID=2986805 RepID=UPI002235E941|nr:carbon-nitrogen hydrolase family protein [Salinibacterium sedimenticola]MCW4386550.1 carbon-nitrogen hydrolase family protein [Salinibacterium sedimenticola]
MSTLTSHGAAEDSPVAIAVAQFAPGSDKEENLETIRDMATTAVARGAELVIFPEYSSFFAPKLDRATVEAAESLDGPFVAGIAAIAKVLGVHIVAGMVEETVGGDRVYNAVVAVDPEGSRVAVYRKLHLYDAFGQRESEWIAPGAIERPEVFEVRGLKVGLQTCYDLRFPEVTRRLVDEGADIVACPSEWVRGPLKEQHWRTLVTARALENTVYLAAADHAPPIGVGNSMVVDPMGVEVATIGETSDIALAWVTKERIESVRSVNPSLTGRRFGVHER